jgi:hypothetical protein
MLKKVCAERGTLTNGWISLDPADMDFIEAVYQKNIREGEERLMLRSWKVLLKTSRNISWHETLAGNSYSGKWRNGF